jgi:hypothetical protein
MEINTDVGLILPRVLYPDGKEQYLCRLLPSPLDLLVRRLRLPILSGKWDYVHAMRFTGYDHEMEVPYLSGCFMFIRNAVFLKAGRFDERFFMYMEDVDLARRINRFYRNVYYPGAVIYHAHSKGSYNNLRSLKQHIISAVRYFNKWGWIFDRERKRINLRVLSLYIKQSEQEPKKGTQC